MNKFIEPLAYALITIAAILLLGIYCMRCERLRMSSQQRAIERMIAEQRLAAKMKEFELAWEDEEEYT